MKKHKTPFMTLTNNYAHAILKKKRKQKLDIYKFCLFLCLLLINEGLLRSHIKNSCFVFHHLIQTPRKH